MMSWSRRFVLAELALQCTGFGHPGKVASSVVLARLSDANLTREADEVKRLAIEGIGSATDRTEGGPSASKRGTWWGSWRSSTTTGASPTSSPPPTRVLLIADRTL